MQIKKYITLIFIVSLSAATEANTFSPGWVEGVPKSIQKSDFNGKSLIFIEMESPVNTNANCYSNGGIVIEDSNESSQAAMTFSLTALVSGKTFSCYINEGRCSQITGSAATFPVCDYYPRIKK